MRKWTKYMGVRVKNFKSEAIARGLSFAEAQKLKRQLIREERFKNIKEGKDESTSSYVILAE